ncbi:hypothetical protein F4780DRAFT_687507 [Xylariomycetidae sp. FL0641]|nr:hypothetical protein F4780DRAFT_687507 [Xylariomycetidae sp. FL0641]
MPSIIPDPIPFPLSLLAAYWEQAGRLEANELHALMSSPPRASETEVRPPPQAQQEMKPRPPTAKTPSYARNPLSRLQWLRARIGAERHDHVVLSASAFGTGTRTSVWRPTEAVSGTPRPRRARSFHEMLGRKLVEAEEAADLVAAAGEAEVVSYPSSRSQLRYPSCGQESAASAPALSSLLERAVEHTFLMAWWLAEWAAYALADYVLAALLPPCRWAWASEAPWWWGPTVCAWWAEVVVVRAPAPVSTTTHESLKRVAQLVHRGDMVVYAAAARRANPDRWGVVAGCLEDLVELTRVLWNISWCFVCFYLWAARRRALAYPSAVWEAVCAARGCRRRRPKLDLELLELD